MLRQRIVTALVLAGFTVAAVCFLTTEVLAVALAAFVCIAAWEWSGFANVRSAAGKVAYLAVIALLLLACAPFLRQPAMDFVVSAGLLWWVFASLLVSRYQKNGAIGLKSSPVKLLLGGMVLIPAWLSLVLIHARENGVTLLLLLFVFVWLCDSAAYFSGKKFGRAKLADRVSPGKTRAGFYGAVAATSLFALACALYAGFSTAQTMALLALSLYIADMAIMGDLVESMFKRMAGLKNSSALLRSHGGLLDRIDSLTSAAPGFYTSLLAIERIS